MKNGLAILARLSRFCSCSAFPPSCGSGHLHLGFFPVLGSAKTAFSRCAALSRNEKNSCSKFFHSVRALTNIHFSRISICCYVFRQEFAAVRPMNLQEFLCAACAQFVGGVLDNGATTTLRCVWYMLRMSDRRLLSHTLTQVILVS